ncbi:LLM class flavin-dependent oxidoreductase [Acetobacter vaccinii]|uniref:LLM class flavin-dependent oxidoreductase n=1 Tax=Acetobacter vaccinii TaxID=2592655 RepID=A0A5C1YMY2_9PROT|nr:LLM class flavin-dependent oxidoreductase [Acetobacter vaccinii]QEO16835.1 LLM class flavin-dependent oxidoreductase [Acetobacter vaccinii]
MTAAPTDRLKLAVLINASGSHIAGWRHPRSGAEQTDELSHYLQIAKKAEAGKFDIVFFADSSALFDGTPEHQARYSHGLAATEPKRHLEPFTLLAALSAGTSNIGLVGSATTTYAEPYSVARVVASLDRLSGGRGGWNLITSANPAEASNFNRTHHLDHATRYERAEEFVDVVRGLWDTLGDGAYVRNREQGVYSDLTQISALNFQGKHFQVSGPLNILRPPQGHPLIAQAGSSEPGRRLAARTADMVFTAQRDIQAAKEFRADIRARTRAAGRNPDHVLVVPGLVPYVGETHQDAHDFYHELLSLIVPDAGLALLAELVGEIDLRSYPLDGPVPEFGETQGSVSRLRLIEQLTHTTRPTIRILYESIAGASGHGFIIGSPVEIADYIEEWYRQGAVDGFNILPPVSPFAFDRFVDLVVPELQRRGLVQSAYRPGSLRDKLGLPRPKNSLLS